MDVDALARDLDLVRNAARSGQTAADLTHFRRIERLGRGLTLVGLAFAWMPNPLSVLALALGSFSRWAIVGHHVSHKGMDRVPGWPKRLRSDRFARGWRRVIDWMDWMEPAAWHHEHDVLHHYHLGEAHHPDTEPAKKPAPMGDPDLAEDRSAFLRDAPLPRWVRVAIVLLGCMFWKPFYYAPNTMNELFNQKAPPEDRFPISSPRFWSPTSRRMWAVALRCWLPYCAWRFGVLPALFLPLGRGAWMAALINLALAELVTNAWSFWVIVPNHTGADLYRFATPTTHRGEFYLRQILGSVDYRTGGFMNDFLHGWLNYQIEHHLFPDLSPRQYGRMHPEVKAICARHGVPFVQQSVLTRARACMRILIGADSMREYAGTVAPQATHRAPHTSPSPDAVVQATG